jgi:ATP synthase protein I
MVKIVLTIAMLFAAPRLIVQLDWLALLAGFVVTIKVYWVAMWLRPGRKDPRK